MNKKIVLAGSISLSLSYLHSYLEENGFSVRTIHFDNELPFHKDIFDIEQTTRELLASLRDPARKELALYTIKALGNRKSITRRGIASVFNQLLDRDIDDHLGIKNEPYMRFLSTFGNRKAINKILLKKNFPGIFKNGIKNLLYIVQDVIEAHKPAIVGLQMNAFDRKDIFYLIMQIHILYPNVKIVVGGQHTSYMYEEILRKFPYVIIVCGEGEQSFLDICRQRKIAKIPGVVFMKGQTLIRTHSRELIRALDTLPFRKHLLTGSTNEVWILTARGCPNKCSFCTRPNGIHENVRYRSIQNIMQELDYIKNKYPQIRTVNIADDTFFIKPERVINFCEEVIKRKFKFKFTCQGRVKPLSWEMVDKLVQAGFSKVELGMESANSDILKRAHKHITQEDIIKAIYLFANTKIEIRIGLIVGLPGETWDTIRETGRFVQRLQKIKYMFNLVPSTAIAYPGTELYRNMQVARKLQPNAWMDDVRDTVLYTVDHDMQTLFAMHEELSSYINLDYFFTWKGFFRQLSVVIFSKDRLKIWRHLLRKKWYGVRL